MINLGLIKDFNSCPVTIPRLSFCVPPGYDPGMNLLKSWPEQDEQAWELVVPRLQGEDPGIWFKRLTGTLVNLKVYAWCVNTHELIRILQLSLDKTLEHWSDYFWPNFKFDSIFYFKSETDVDKIRQILIKWHKTEPLICFRERYDLTIEKVLDAPSEKEKKPENNFKRMFNGPLSYLRAGKQ